jgi:phospholipase A1
VYRTGLQNPRSGDQQGNNEFTIQNINMSPIKSWAIAFITLSTLVASTAAIAQSEPLSSRSCSSMLDAAARLECFDQLAKQSKGCENINAPEKRLQCYDKQSQAEGLSKTTPEDQQLSLVQKRYVEQARLEDDSNPWFIVPHRQTYILPYSYLFSGVNTAPYSDAASDGTEIDTGLKNYEAKYQISFAIPLWRNMFGSRNQLLFGYTQISVWQVYSRDISSPFRDTDYEPELIWRIPVDKKLGDISFDIFQLSLDHQSNGRADPLSRSWNRIIASFAFSSGDWVCAVRPWYRIPENADDDNNPDIEKYYGYGEFWSWYIADRNTFGLMLRNNLRSDGNLTTVQLDWSFPIHAQLKGYVQYFNGYGETLVDYNYRNIRLGAGVMLVNVF